MTFKHLSSLLLVLALTNAFGQAPVITHIDKIVGGNGERITISGSNFGNNPANLVVWFGGTQGVIDASTATDQTLEVAVPPGATYESIVITNTSTGQSAWSSSEFLLSYGGEVPLSLTNLVAQADKDTETGLFDLCMCDLDGDGRNDVAGTSSGGVTAPANGVSIYRNTTAAPGPFSFASKVSFLASTKALNIKCGDLNGDGKKELIISEADPGTRVLILKNASTAGTLSFTQQSFSFPRKSPKRVDIADLDGDGLPELVITDQNTSNKDLLIIPNTSSGGLISFGDQIVLPVETTGSDGLALQDVDNDNKTDIIISHFLSSSGNVFVYHNKSHVGTFDFSEVIKADVAPGSPSSTGAPVNVRVGDIDGDSKPDIAVTHFLGSRISVLLNQSTSTEVKFGAPTSVTTDPYPFGLDIGDLDGDGKPEIAVASLTGPTPNAKSLTILNNTSSVGSVSFIRLTQPTTFINRHIVIGDIDGDSKPDIAYTSVDDNTNGIPASKLSFFRNKSCIVPKITPGGSIVVCSSFPLTLEASKSAGATYTWKESGTANGTVTQTFTPSASGVYTVDLTSDGCTRGSNAVTITVSTGTAATPDINNPNSPLCEGGTITLSIDTPVGGETYNWTGPGGFTATGSTMNRPSYVPEFAGRYEVEVINNGCLAAKGFALVETVSLPSFNVSFTGSDVICTGDTKLLTAQPADANFSYQWTDENGDIGGATTSTYSANATGSYSFRAKSLLYAGCPEVEAEAIDIHLATIPAVNFQSPAETCKDVITTFTNQSTVDDEAGPKYKWEFGDGGISADASATHTYSATAPSLTVKLTVSYRGDACAQSFTRPIKVSDPPTASITTPGGVFEICNGEQLTLGVDNTFSEYKWSTDETTPTITVSAADTYEVRLKNAIGCKITVSKVVELKPAPAIAIEAEKNPINLGEQTKLSATAGFPAYEWAPAESLDDPTSQTPIAKPVVPTEYTVTVVGDNGCVGTATLNLVVNVDNPTNLLQPFNFFSPNGDGTNPVWEVGNISSFPQCGVTIFDEKGVKVFDAKPYNNDWDGTSNGKKLPDGVYYYVIRCEGDSGTKAGSITILR